jgi:hypothetical protein
MKVAVFSAEYPSDLQERINNWFKKQPRGTTVSHIVQSQSCSPMEGQTGGDTTMVTSIFYEGPASKK